MKVVGIIGGSGLYEIAGLGAAGEEKVSTPFGEPSAPYVVGEMDGVKVAFLARHGVPHRLQPHRVNYRANIWGFRELGAERILAVSSSGGIGKRYRPGSIVVLDQAVDMTQGARASTFYEADEVVHIDFTEPYCPELRATLLSAGRKSGVKLIGKGTYACVNGPRLESRAEIAFLARAGAHVVGMTGMPEAALARELEMCFATLAVVTNYAAGIEGRKLTADEVVEGMRASNENIKALLKTAIGLIPHARSCTCKDALKGARI